LQIILLGLDDEMCTEDVVLIDQKLFANGC